MKVKFSVFFCLLICSNLYALTVREIKDDQLKQVCSKWREMPFAEIDITPKDKDLISDWKIIFGLACHAQVSYDERYEIYIACKEEQGECADENLIAQGILIGTPDKDDYRKEKWHYTITDLVTAPFNLGIEQNRLKRTRGAATLLINHIKNRAKMLEMSYLLLTPLGTSVEFYLKLGFEKPHPLSKLLKFNLDPL